MFMSQQKKNISRDLVLIAQSSIIVFMGIGASKLLTYIYRIIIARSFGPESYGLFGAHSLIFNILQNAAKVLFLLFFIAIGLNNLSIAWSYLGGVVIMMIV